MDADLCGKDFAIREDVQKPRWVNLLDVGVKVEVYMKKHTLDKRK